MSKTTKILIGVVVAAVIIVGGYMFLNGQNSNNATQNANSTNGDQGVIM